jgi:dihydropteroate synthase
MQVEPKYEDVVAEVNQFLASRVEACLAQGIAADQIILDPGFGFGKTVSHNLACMKHLPALVAMGMPVLVGASRKSTIGSILNKPVDERLYGSLALASLAVWHGASIIRVHDVGPTADTINMIQAVKSA